MRRFFGSFTPLGEPLDGFLKRGWKNEVRSISEQTAFETKAPSSEGGRLVVVPGAWWLDPDPSCVAQRLFNEQA